LFPEEAILAMHGSGSSAGQRTQETVHPVDGYRLVVQHRLFLLLLLNFLAIGLILFHWSLSLETHGLAETPAHFGPVEPQVEGDLGTGKQEQEVLQQVLFEHVVLSIGQDKGTPLSLRNVELGHG